MRIPFTRCPYLPAFFLACLLGIAPEARAGSNLKDTLEHFHILKVIDLNFHQQYASADSLLDKELPKNNPAYWYFKGLVACTRYNDLGDTAALSKSGQYWKHLAENKFKKNNPADARQTEVYRGLSYLQLSYVAAQYSRTFKSFFHIKSGVGLLKKNTNYIEAMCSLKIYEYYKQDLLKFFRWLPFVEVDRESPQNFLLKHYKSSPYLSALFLTPLIWMHFDMGMYQKGLDLTRGFLKQYPENRVFRLMAADFLYKLKEYEAAAKTFESVKKEYGEYYAEHPGEPYIPINHWSAAGNLVRVYDGWNKEDLKRTNSEIWFSQEVRDHEDWLPGSLWKDLERFEKK